MIYLEDSTTFSGADVKVYIYKNLDVLKGPDTNTVIGKSDLTTEIDISDHFASKIASANQNNSSTPTGLRTEKQRFNGPLNEDDAKELDNQIAYERSEKKKLENLRNTGGLPVKELGTLYALNYSSFREKVAVRTLGRTHAKAYTRGQRTIAGSMVFTIFQSHELMDFAKQHNATKNDIVLLDQIPAFNLMIIMANEYGGASILHLFNVDINTESQSISVDDLSLVNTLNFYAQDIVAQESLGNIFENTEQMLREGLEFGSVFANSNGKRYAASSLLSIDGLSKSSEEIQRLISQSRGLF